MISLGELTYLSQGMQLSLMDTHSQKPAKKNSFLFKRKKTLKFLQHLERKVSTSMQHQCV